MILLVLLNRFQDVKNKFTIDCILDYITIKIIDSIIGIIEPFSRC